MRWLFEAPTREKPQFQRDNNKLMKTNSNIAVRRREQLDMRMRAHSTANLHPPRLDVISLTESDDSHLLSSSLSPRQTREL